MAQAMRSTSAGTQCRATSSGRRAAAPRVAIAPRAVHKQQQDVQRAAAVAASRAGRTSHVARAATAQQEAPQQQAQGTKVRRRHKVLSSTVLQGVIGKRRAV